MIIKIVLKKRKFPLKVTKIVSNNTKVMKIVEVKQGNRVALLITMRSPEMPMLADLPTCKEAFKWSNTKTEPIRRL